LFSILNDEAMGSGAMGTTAAREDTVSLANLIAGESRPAAGGEVAPVTNPATGENLAEVPLSGPADVDAAVLAAREAGPAWAALSVPRRADIMFAARELILAAHEELARLVVLENGKGLADASGEISRGLEVVQFATAIGTHLQGVTMTSVGRGVDAETRLYPVGVVAGITPFNFPGMIPLWMIPVALAAGNTFVLKPSEQTPLTAARLVELFHEAGVPDGVLNLVHGGVPAAEALLVHPDVAAVSFVGSAPVAKHVYATAAANGKRVQALAGAKNFLIVLDDAPLDEAADAVFASAFGNAGQRCLAGSVVLATPGIRGSLTQALAERVAAAPSGSGLDERNLITPVISPAARERILAGVARAVEAGAEVVVGGEAVDGPGFFLTPTILTGVDPGMEIVREELFGPALAIMEVSDLGAAIELANTSEFGNSSSIFTSSGSAARRFREELEAGMLGINIGVPAPIGYLPFSGWKGSFFGDLHANGMDALRFYTRSKSITTRWMD
jgi:malonate-semialdehyde dehydrogenase (acetylating) / methylmalonate-semialdehyde dehydrogenase